MVKKEVQLFKPFVSKESLLYVHKVLRSNYIGQGKYVDQFETCLSDIIQSKYVLSTNSCTSSLQIALRLIEKKSGIVLTTPLTCLATTNAILLDGRFKIEWIDVDKETCNINLDSLKEKVNKHNPAAVVLVHWGGLPNDLNSIKEICGNIPVIEDCAHALGSKYDGKFIGNHGNLSAFSFQAIKSITCGDGGALSLPNKKLYERANRIRWFGINRKNREDVNNYTDLGGKWNMNDINAAIGLGNMKYLDFILGIHKSNSNFYDDKIKNSNVFKMKKMFNSESSCWLYTLIVENKKDFEIYMKGKGIETGLHHKRNDKFSVIKKQKAYLPILDSFYDNLTNIPVGWWVSNEEREYIVDCINCGW